MFWADEVALKIKERKLPLEWVDDMKTPSGRVHVGSLLGVAVHGLVHKALVDAGVNTKFTYVFENHDPMDDIPSYLSKEEYEKYLGMPLYKIPSPEKGYKDFADYYAQEFVKTFNAIGFYPEILWTKDLYTSGKMNEGIKKVLDSADKIRKIYEELYKKDIAKDWYPFQVYCEKCGKVSTTRVHSWDGEFVSYRCLVDATDWTKGCGHEGKVSPFSNENILAGKMPWKVEWAVKWQAIGVTVEGAGKDHMSRGGSHDLASLVAQRVLSYPVPYPVGYEFILIGGKKMSSSKGRGFAAADMLEILPPELVRFLLVKMNIRQQMNFDPTDPETIPKLFDEYQKAAEAYYSSSERSEATRLPARQGSSHPDLIGTRTIKSEMSSDSNIEYLARVFELSQVSDSLKKPPSVRFSTLAQWVQMPNMQEQITKEGAEDWAKYAKIWVEKYASEKDRFSIQQQIPKIALNLFEKQKEFLKVVSEKLSKDWDPEELQKELYEWAKQLGISSKEAFSAIYICLIGKDHGPKAGWLLLSLDKDFVQSRFKEIANSTSLRAPTLGRDAAIPKIVSSHASRNDNVQFFSIAREVAEKFPSITVGEAIIKGVTIEKKNEELEKEKEVLLSSLSSLTTEELSQYPEIVSYRKLYKATGIDWHSRRPSPEALLRRVALKKGLYNVSTCVDAYNIVVMKHRVSVGAFDFDTLTFPVALRFAKEGEEILLLGEEVPTRFKLGEIAYFDTTGAINMDFNYRDSKRSAVTLASENIYVNVEGVFDISAEKVEEVLKEAVDMIVKYSGGTVEAFGVHKGPDDYSSNGVRSSRPLDSNNKA